jgi:hypothetical protein
LSGLAALGTERFSQPYGNHCAGRNIHDLGRSFLGFGFAGGRIRGIAGSSRPFRRGCGRARFIAGKQQAKDDE